MSVRTVTLGPGDATNIAITQGLKPGETVVVDGADKLKDGAKVVLRQASGASGGASAGGAAAGSNAPGQGQQKGQHQGQHKRQQQNNQNSSSGQGGG